MLLDWLCIVVAGYKCCVSKISLYCGKWGTLKSINIVKVEVQASY